MRVWACVGWEMGETTIPHVCIYYKHSNYSDTMLHTKLIGKNATPDKVQDAFDELAVGIRPECFEAAPLHERERLFLNRYAKKRPPQ